LNLISFVPPENKLLANFSITLLKDARAKDILTFTSLKETIINEMSVKRSFGTHLIPGLLRSYAAPAILQIFEIR